MLVGAAEVRYGTKLKRRAARRRVKYISATNKLDIGERAGYSQASRSRGGGVDLRTRLQEYSVCPMPRYDPSSGIHREDGEG